MPHNPASGSTPLKIRAVLFAVACQAPDDIHYQGEIKLMLAVFKQALADAYLTRSFGAKQGATEDARWYIKHDLQCLHVLGINREWARSLIKGIGLEL